MTLEGRASKPGTVSGAGSGGALEIDAGALEQHRPGRSGGGRAGVLQRDVEKLGGLDEVPAVFSERLAQRLGAGHLQQRARGAAVALDRPDLERLALVGSETAQRLAGDAPGALEGGDSTAKRG